MAPDPRIRTEACGCRYSVKTGEVLHLCDEHGDDDERPLFDPEDVGR